MPFPHSAGLLACAAALTIVASQPAAAAADPAAADQAAIDSGATKPATPHHAHHRGVARQAQQTASNQIAPLAPANQVPLADPNAAPTPNENVTAPIDTSDQSTTVKPDVMQIHYPPQGDGYVTGSSAQAMDDREAAKVTGLQMHVPLGQ